MAASSATAAAATFRNPANWPFLQVSKIPTEMRRESARRRTLKAGGWSEEGAAQSAGCGFYIHRTTTSTTAAGEEGGRLLRTCAFCGLHSSLWALENHLQFSPDCPFANRDPDCGNVTVEQEQENQRKELLSMGQKLGHATRERAKLNQAKEAADRQADGLRRANEDLVKEREASDRRAEDLARQIATLNREREALTRQLRRREGFYDLSRGGVVLVFSQSFDRDGNNSDLTALREAFEPMPGVAVVTEELRNLTAEQILNFQFPDFLLRSRPTFRNVKKLSFLCVVLMAHGNRDEYGRESFLASDMKTVWLAEFAAKFMKNERCPRAARGKPKIMFVSNCRGEEFNWKIQDDCLPKPKAVANVRDTYVMRGSVQGVNSPRHRSHGNFFIQALCGILRECPWVEMDGLFRLVAERMEEDWNRRAGPLQQQNVALVPEATTTLTKPFRFCVPPESSNC